MYNSKQKQEYLDSEKVNMDSLRRYFTRLELKEKEYGKDICEMNQYELLDTIKSLSIRREDTRGHLLSLLRGYVDWARLKGIDNCQTSIYTITPESAGSGDVVKNTMIKDPTHLRLILDDGLDYINYENKSKMAELLLWLLYQGISLEEIRDLQKDAIDYNTNAVKISDGTIYKVDDRIASLWKKCADITYLEKKNGRATTSKNNNVNEYIKYELIDNNYLFRSIAGNKGHTNTPCSLNQLRKIISNVFISNEAKTIPARNINYSGLFYKLYLLEKEGKQITPEIFAEYFSVKYKDRNELLANTRKWRIDYDDWKIAFEHM